MCRPHILSNLAQDELLCSLDFFRGRGIIHLIQNSDRELLEVMVSMVKGRAIVLISIVRATCLR